MQSGFHLGRVPAVPLIEHQVDDVKWLLERMSVVGGGILGHDVGGGKTFGAIVAAHEAAAMRPAGHKVLVVCPLSVSRQWVTAWETLYPGVRAQSGHGNLLGAPFSPAARKAVIETGHWDVLIVNYDLLPAIAPMLAKVPWACVIADEAHRLKGYRGMRGRSGIQAKALFTFSDRAALRIGLTGTPILNGPEDAFGLYRVVNKSIFGDVRFQFDNKWFYNVSRDRRFSILVLRPDMRAQFTDIVNENMRRLTKRELPVKFPAETVARYVVAMPRAVRKVYDDLIDESIAYLESGATIERRHILGRKLALQMLASGAFSQEVLRHDGFGEDGEPVFESYRDVHVIDMSHKMRVVTEILDSLGDQPAVLWAHFRHEIDALRDLLEKRKPGGCVVIDGRVTGGERVDAVTRFQSGSAQWLVGQPQAAGEGLNLQIANNDIFLSRSYSLKDWVQSSGRTPRIGSKHDSVTHHVIITEQSEDVVIDEALTEKRNEASDITRDGWLLSLRQQRTAS